MNQQVTFLTDSGEDVRDLPLYLNPQAEHDLDWFQVTMRITLMNQLPKSLRSRDHPDLATQVANELERLKWFFMARQRVPCLAGSRGSEALDA